MNRCVCGELTGAVNEKCTENWGSKLVNDDVTASGSRETLSQYLRVLNNLMPIWQEKELVVSWVL